MEKTAKMPENKYNQSVGRCQPVGSNSKAQPNLVKNSLNLLFSFDTNVAVTCSSVGLLYRVSALGHGRACKKGQARPGTAHSSSSSGI